MKVAPRCVPDPCRYPARNLCFVFVHLFTRKGAGIDLPKCVTWLWLCHIAHLFDERARFWVIEVQNWLPNMLIEYSKSGTTPRISEHLSDVTMPS